MTMSVLACVFLLIYIIMNASYISDHEMYRKKYKDLQRGIYRFQSNDGSNVHFNLYSYDIESVTFQSTNCEIIFFADGDIKLTENLYIHKSHLFMSLYSWYYWRKFQKLKWEKILSNEYRERAMRLEDSRREHYMNQQKKDFKFLRG